MAQLTAANILDGTNRLIDALPVNEREQVVGSSDCIVLEFGDTIAHPDEVVTEVFFPVAGYVSEVFQLENHGPLAMNLVGNEGMLGSSLVLGLPSTPLQSMVQGPGSCLSISRARFLLLLADCPALLALIRRYHFVSGMQLARTAACTHFHDIEQRLARWLLMTHDRAQVDHFHLTHGLLAALLGVRRSGVTVAAGSLQARSLISYTRGEILVLDREGLEAQACVCYRDVLEDYARYLPACVQLRNVT